MLKTLNVVGWWLAFGLARLGTNVLVLLMLGPMHLLYWLEHARDAAEIDWLLACTARRVAARQRLDAARQVGDAIAPLPGSDL